MRTRGCLYSIKKFMRDSATQYFMVVFSTLAFRKAWASRAGNQTGSDHLLQNLIRPIIKFNDDYEI